MDANPLQGANAAWLEARTGCLTASRMADALAVLKNGKPAAARTALVRTILAERLTGNAAQTFVNAAMQHGIDTESEVRSEYEAASGNVVQLVGFVRHPTIEHCGASPDGLIDDDGLAEFKCPATTTHLEWMRDGQAPEEHQPQMLLQLACTRRKWCDFVSYDPRIKVERLRLFVVRFAPTPEQIAEVEDKAREFLAEVDAYWRALTER